MGRPLLPSRCATQYRRTDEADTVHAGITSAVVRDGQEFALLEAEWDELHRASRGATPFQSWAWMYSWWESYGTGYDLRLVTMRDPAGSLVALIPLVLERRLGFGRLLFAGTGLTDYQDILVREGWEDRVGAASRAALRRLPGWHVADLHQLRPGSAAWEAFRRWHGPRTYLRHDGSPVVEVRPWEEIVAALGKDQRKVVRRTFRRAEVDGLHSRFVGPGEAERSAQRLIALHRQQWTDRNMTPEHSTLRWESFVRSAVRRLVDRGLGEVSEFRHGDEVVMVLFWVTGEGFVGIYYSGVSRTILPRYQWSTLLVRAGIDLAGSRGATHLDMLRGEHEYKLQWASDVVPSRRLVLGRGPVAWSCYAGHLVARRRLERFVLSERCPPAVRNAARAVRNAAVAARRHQG